MHVIERMESLPRSPRTEGLLKSPATRTLQEEWKQVHVDKVDVCPPRTADSGQEIVRAIVCLGALLPCDVRVELLAVSDGRRGGHVLDVCRRLFSVEPLANGCYVFEARLPAGTLQAAEGGVIRISSWPDTTTVAPVTERVLPWRRPAGEVPATGRQAREMSVFG